MSYLIRKMARDDIEAVFALGISRPEFSSANGSFWTKEQLKSWLESNHDLLLVAEDGGEIIGFSFYAVHQPTGKVTWENLYVAKNNRQTGVGEALIAEGLKCLKEMGYQYVALQNNAEDPGKFATYLENFGFKKGSRCLWMDQILD